MIHIFRYIIEKNITYILEYIKMIIYIYALYSLFLEYVFLIRKNNVFPTERPKLTITLIYKLQPYLISYIYAVS